MLMELLSNKGSASVKEVAKAILLHDKSQVDCYSNITKQMPGRVLGKNHNLSPQLAVYKLLVIPKISAASGLIVHPPLLSQ